MFQNMYEHLINAGSSYKQKAECLIPGIRLAPSDTNLATICIGILPTYN